MCCETYFSIRIKFSSRITSAKRFNAILCFLMIQFSGLAFSNKSCVNLVFFRFALTVMHGILLCCWGFNVSRNGVVFTSDFKQHCSQEIESNGKAHVLNKTRISDSKWVIIMSAAAIDVCVQCACRKTRQWKVINHDSNSCTSIPRFHHSIRSDHLLHSKMPR